MKQVAPRIWQWSWFSEEKQLDFNGHVLDVGEHRVVVDPPPMTDHDRAQVTQGGNVDYIVVTNRDHVREADAFRSEWQCQLMVPEADAAEMEMRADKTFRDGELLPGGIWVVQLAHQKSPGESALYLQQGKGILVVGDALIGDPQGRVRLLPAEKYVDDEQAKVGLQRLLKYEFDALLVGDGASILSGAKSVVAAALS